MIWVFDYAGWERKVRFAPVGIACATWRGGEKIGYKSTQNASAFSKALEVQPGSSICWNICILGRKYQSAHPLAALIWEQAP